MKSHIEDPVNLSLWAEAESVISSLPKTLSMPDGDVIIYHHFFDKEASDSFFQQLLTEIKWRQDIIKYYGKEINLPRLTAWYGDRGKSYTYSGIPMNPEPWTAPLRSVKKKIEEIAKVDFNSVLLNLYRNGRDGVSWHSDNEPELGENPVVGSVSFGQTRTLQFRHRLRKDLGRVDVNLTHGSLLLMKGTTQRFWQHQIPKTTRPLAHRINLTFRVIH
jgi:alkylated DNA repair dioxygenase AlkB